MGRLRHHYISSTGPAGKFTVLWRRRWGGAGLNEEGTADRHGKPIGFRPPRNLFWRGTTKSAPPEAARLPQLGSMRLAASPARRAAQ
ncbi:hypothetical protein NSPZN2_10837 [Nitrospira defluvii]|uniref:Uncharacterized protein n=1 Tax=Nitrospira defluvii TaxID=330214 RepID=A0ABN7KP08_9BACT|nr:hypothetical protein NSPZN2_10837 [Nitrospira defluvii]